MGWLRGKKEATINNNSSFKNGLNDVLNYQNIKRGPQRISKLKPYINKYSWEGIDFPAGPKEWKKIESNNKTMHLIYYSYHTIQKQKGLHIDQNITTSVKSK